MIKEFRGEYYFLSNFSSSPIKVDDLIFLNAEALFHACKNPHRAREFQYLDPSAAKRLGRQVNLRPDWEEIKDKTMYSILLLKFDQNPGLKKKLLATGSECLEEGNNWHDNYWGICRCSRCKSELGQNRLGKLLMLTRDHFHSN